MARRQTVQASVSEVVAEARRMGFVVRFSGWTRNNQEGEQVFDVTWQREAFARRTEAGIREIVAGTDAFFNEARRRA